MYFHTTTTLLTDQGSRAFASLGRGISSRLSLSNLPAIAIKIIQYPICSFIFQIMPEIMPQRESKKTKCTIATWLLETDSKSEDVDYEENQSAAPSAGEIPPTAGPLLDMLAMMTECIKLALLWRPLIQKQIHMLLYHPLNTEMLVLHWNEGLTLNDLVRINNYFFCRVLKMCKGFPIDWATGLAMSHTQTLLIAYRHQDLFLQDEDCPPTSDIEAVNRFVEQKAWEQLVGYTGCTTDGKPKSDAADVDMETLILLEM
ncbi:hypothetical protein EV421DRAFT_1745304 [Armillaria borealis]|uniref:Uncharacterized protein n=1 Tax=Armillaria borealis TaxID=47425 RepID=A0AA39ISJ8_9AGAR|nr:hypothetical protein EV421DRAFT_1745304 [Armillaria borealis]